MSVINSCTQCFLAVQQNFYGVPFLVNTCINQDIESQKPKEEKWKILINCMWTDFFKKLFPAHSEVWDILPNQAANLEHATVIFKAKNYGQPVNHFLLSTGKSYISLTT